jgi:hypothetical protein
MKKLCLIALCVLPTIEAISQCKIDYSNYHLVLNEEFNTSIADLSTRWAFDTGDPEHIGWGVEYYDPNQISFLPGGILRLKATQVVPFVKTTPGGNSKLVKYKSGILRSTMIVDPGGWQECGFQYGIFEMRAKIPKGRTVPGTGEWDAWPAFWMYNGFTEIDIIDGLQPDPSRIWQMAVIDWKRYPYLNATDWDMICDCNVTPLNSLCSSPEFSSTISYSAQSVVKLFNKIYRSNKATKKTATDIFAKKKLYDLSETYNTYTCAWTPTKVTFFLNGVEVATISNTNIATHPYPNRIFANLEMMEGGADPEYVMDIDYIKVWKPNNGDYSLPYKSTSEFIHRDLFQDLSLSEVSAKLVSAKANSIANNSGNTNELFYRDMNDYICVARRDILSTPPWSFTRIPRNDGSVVNASGDVRYLPQHDMVLYVGTDSKIHYFGRSAVEPSGFYHWAISSNFNCYWCVTDDYISQEPGSLQTSQNGEIFFRGQDNKMHRYYMVNGTWTHQILPSSYNGGDLVAGDLVVDPDNTIFYRGADGRLQCFYKDGGNYVHIWIDQNWGTAEYVVNTKPGSLVSAPSVSGALYIGYDNKIHLFYWDVTWKHLLLPYNYGDPGLGYQNGDYAFSGLSWDNANKRVYYQGFDGRLQAFTMSGTNWSHSWIDSYWNTDEFLTYQLGDHTAYGPKYASTIVTPTGTHYSRRDGHLSLFRYQTCQILNPPPGYSPNLYKQENPDEDGQGEEELSGIWTPTRQHPGYMEMGKVMSKTIEPSHDNAIYIFPNPSKNGQFNLRINTDLLETNCELEVSDVLGRIIFKEKIVDRDRRIDLSKNNAGIYFVTINYNGYTVRKKLVKSQ